VFQEDLGATLAPDPAAEESGWALRCHAFSRPALPQPPLPPNPPSPLRVDCLFLIYCNAPICAHYAAWLQQEGSSATYIRWGLMIDRPQGRYARSGGYASCWVCIALCSLN